MKTLIIYDDQGTIFLQVTGNYSVPQGGIQFLEVVIPEGKRITRIDTSVAPHQPILEDIPPSEVEVLESQVAELTYQLMMKGVL